VRRFSQTVITSRWLVMIPLLGQEPAPEDVGGGNRVAGQAAAQRGADGVREHGEHDVEVDVGRRAGHGVEAEGADGLSEALLDVHPPGPRAADSSEAGAHDRHDTMSRCEATPSSCSCGASSPSSEEP
jgi:hypothetical protein